MYGPVVPKPLIPVSIRGVPTHTIREDVPSLHRPKVTRPGSDRSVAAFLCPGRVPLAARRFPTVGNRTANVANLWDQACHCTERCRAGRKPWRTDGYDGSGGADQDKIRRRQNSQDCRLAGDCSKRIRNHDTVIAAISECYVGQRKRCLCGCGMGLVQSRYH